MRVFQNSGVYRSYRPRLRALTAGARTFAEARRAFLDDRFGAAHFLLPVLAGEPEAFFANGDDEPSQRMWAAEQGLGAAVPLDQILLAQIEHHRTEVFYNLDPMRYGDAFLRRLPGGVKRTIAWRAAPSAGGAFLNHDLIVNNFPSILAGYRAAGARADYFLPGHDPAMDAYATNDDRPIDVLFVGSYSRHHVARARMLDAIARLRGEMAVVMHLDRSRFTALAESPLGWIGPLRGHRRSRDIRAVARPPVFGRDLLGVLGKAKIVVNGAIDMAGAERGNMRVWEALGCGAALVSDRGLYPEDMTPDIDFATYGSVDEVVATIRTLRADDGARRGLAATGNQMIRTRYSKERQWARFVALAQ